MYRRHRPLRRRIRQSRNRLLFILATLLAPTKSLFLLSDVISFSRVGIGILELLLERLGALFISSSQIFVVVATILCTNETVFYSEAFATFDACDIFFSAHDSLATFLTFIKGSTGRLAQRKYFTYSTTPHMSHILSF